MKEKLPLVLIVVVTLFALNFGAFAQNLPPQKKITWENLQVANMVKNSKLITDAINDSGAKVYDIYPLPDYFGYEVRFTDRDGNKLRAFWFETPPKKIWVETTRGPNGSADNLTCDVYRAINDANKHALSWPATVFSIEYAGYLYITSTYNIDGSITQKDLTNYFESVDFNINDTYGQEPALIKEFGIWSK